MKLRYLAALAAFFMLGPAQAQDCTVDLCGLSGGTMTGLRSTFVDELNTETIAGAKTFSGTLDVTGTLQIGSTSVTATAAELNQYPLTTCIADISTGQSDWVVAPHAGDIATIYSVIDGTIGTGDATLTFEIGGTAVTGGAITVTASGSAAGDVDSSTPSAANTVTAGQAIEILTDGASTNVVEVCVTMLITR